MEESKLTSKATEPVDQLETIEDIEKLQAKLVARKAAMQQPREDAETKHSFEQPIKTSDSNTGSEKPSAAVLVLQWLTYAFWGWTALAFAALLINVLWHFIVNPSQGTMEFSPYGIAAVVVLLPISFVCDAFYKKYDVQDKTGASSIVMIIHAVVFALFAIGSLIAGVLSSVMLFTSTQTDSDVTVLIVAGFVMAVVYLVTFLRTLRPKRLVGLAKVYPVLMSVLAIFLIGLAAFGPLQYSVQSKNDRLIEENIDSLVSSINKYADKERTLPKDLSVLQFDSYRSSTKKLVENDLVEYKANTKQALEPKTSVRPGTTGSSDYMNKITGKQPIFYYQLCVNYRFEGVNHDYGESILDQNEEYQEYIERDNHPKGNVCYKIQTREYYDDYYRSDYEATR